MRTISFDSLKDNLYVIKPQKKPGTPCTAIEFIQENIYSETTLGTVEKWPF